MKFTSIVCLAAAMFLSDVEGRRRIMDHSGTELSQARVRAEECPEICVFKDQADNQWCFQSESPHLKVGWQFDQKYGETDSTKVVKYYDLRFMTYAEAEFYLKSVFDVIKIYYNEFVVDLPKFKVGVFFAQQFTSRFEWCPGLGYKVETIELKLQSRMEIMQCYKTLIVDICNFLTAYKGKEAKIFEKCERSQTGDSQVKLDFTTFEFLKKLEDRVWMGTVDPESSVFCNDIFGVALAEHSPISIYQKSLIASVGNYIGINYLNKEPIFPTNVYELP